MPSRICDRCFWTVFIAHQMVFLFFLLVCSSLDDQGIDAIDCPSSSVDMKYTDNIWDVKHWCKGRCQIVPQTLLCPRPLPEVSSCRQVLAQRGPFDCYLTGKDCDLVLKIYSNIIELCELSGAHWSADPGLWKDPPGYHPLSQQSHPRSDNGHKGKLEKNQS